MHEISSSIMPTIPEVKKSSKTKKKNKHQTILGSFFLYNPKSKYFGSPGNKTSESVDPCESESKNNSPQQIITIDKTFIMMDFVFTMNKSFDQYLLPILSNKILFIAEREKMVRSH